MLGLDTFVAGPLSDTYGHKPVIINGYGWRGLFASFIMFALILAFWLALRQPETLQAADRRPIHFNLLWQGKQFCPVVWVDCVAVAAGRVCECASGRAHGHAAFGDATFLAHLAVTQIVLALMQTMPPEAS